MSRRRRDTVALAIGTFVAGTLAYAFFALTTRALGAEASAPIAILWTWWSATVAILTFPLQHWVIRTVAADGTGRRVSAAMPSIWASVGGLAVVSGGAAFVARQTLFGSDDPIFPASVAAITVGSCFVGLVRGGLASREQFTSVAWALASENVMRVALAVVAIVADAGAAALALVLVSGQATGLLWRSALEFEAPQPSDSKTSPFAFLGGIAGGSVMGQFVLTGGPVVLTMIGGAAADVTALFVSLAVFRAPYIFALGQAVQVTGILTRYVVDENTQHMAAVRRWTVLATLGCAILAGLGAYAIGPQFLRSIFGADLQVGRATVTAVAVGTCLGLGGLMFTLTLVARETARPVAVSWLGAIAVACVWIAVAPGTPLSRVVGGFVAAEAISFMLLLGFESRLLRRDRHRMGLDGRSP